MNFQYICVVIKRVLKDFDLKLEQLLSSREHARAHQTYRMWLAKNSERSYRERVSFQMDNSTRDL